MGFKTGKRKKILLVNRDFQLRHTKSAIVVGLISTFLTSVVILYPLYQFNILRIPKFLPLPILAAMLIAATINIAIIGFMGILMTHRIAGPMYSLVRSFRSVGLGHFGSKMSLREDDDLRFLVRNFNDMLSRLHHITDQDLSAVVAMQVILDDLPKNDDLQSLRIALEKHKLSLSSRLSGS